MIQIFGRRDRERQEGVKIWKKREKSYKSATLTRDGRFDSKVGQICPKWDKSGAFSYQISVHLAPADMDP